MCILRKCCRGSYMLLFQFDVSVAAELRYLSPLIYFVYFTNHYDYTLQTIMIDMYSIYCKWFS